MSWSYHDLESWPNMQQNVVFFHQITNQCKIFHITSMRNTIIYRWRERSTDRNQLTSGYITRCNHRGVSIDTTWCWEIRTSFNPRLGETTNTHQKPSKMIFRVLHRQYFITMPSLLPWFCDIGVQDKYASQKQENGLLSECYVRSQGPYQYLYNE